MTTSILQRAANTKENPYQLDKGFLPNNTAKRRLAPYGREADLLLSYAVKPRNDIFLFAGLNGWRKAKLFAKNQIILLLPYGKDPSDYFWPVAGCPVLLFDTGFLSVLDIEKIAYCLLRSDASIVRAVLSNNRLIIYGGTT